MPSLGSALPHGEARSVIAAFLAQSINEAHESHSGRWGLTQWSDQLRLNVGQPEVMTTRAERIRVLVRLDSLPEGLASIPDVQVEPSPYRSIPGSGVCTIERPERDDLSAILDQLRAPHLELVRQASRTGLNGMTRTGHSPDAVREVGIVARTQLPQPSYVIGEPPSIAPDV